MSPLHKAHSGFLCILLTTHAHSPLSTTIHRLDFNTANFSAPPLQCQLLTSNSPQRSSSNRTHYTPQTFYFSLLYSSYIERFCLFFIIIHRTSQELQRNQPNIEFQLSRGTRRSTFRGIKWLMGKPQKEIALMTFPNYSGDSFRILANLVFGTLWSSVLEYYYV